ncbi:MAG: hypothetical protein SFT92_01840 [Rickettsiales bacterium]|nr:hypothetical protein [Rickettsiales bacterium]
MISAINNALAGLTSASQRLENSAKTLAKPLTLESGSEKQQAMIDMTIAKEEFKANLTSIKKQDEMEEFLLNILT